MALAALAASAVLADERDAHARVRIRGRGSNVVIEGDRAGFRGPADTARRLLAEAARLKRRGEDDAAVIAYLRGHEADLPTVIDSSDLARLRAAGAGKAVIAYLASVAAADIGPTGEGGHVAAMPPVEPAEFESAPYGSYPRPGYPAYWSAPYGFARPFRHRGNSGFHRREPLFRGHMPGPRALAPRSLLR